MIQHETFKVKFNLVRRQKDHQNVVNVKCLFVFSMLMKLLCEKCTLFNDVSPFIKNWHDLQPSTRVVTLGN